MRNQILLILLISFSLTSCSQTPNKNIEFDKIGWSILLPDGFTIIDSSGIASSIAKGRALVDSSIKKIEPSERKILIVAKKGSNTFLSTITPFDEGKDGNWKSSNQLIREVLYQTLANKFPSVKFDSSSAMETISSLTFNKFVIQGKENDEVVYNSTMLSKMYKGFDFEISYVYVEDIVGKEIEEMIKQSKFTR